MNSIILSSGIEGIDWTASINLLVAANGNVSHFENMMLNTKGKYDDLVVEKTDNDASYKKLKPLFNGFVTRLLKKNKKQITFLSDPIFLDSGPCWKTLNENKSFAFFFCSPEYYLAKIEDDINNGENIDQQECLDTWLESARKIWEFYVRYPESTLLINVEDVEKNPQLSVAKIYEFFGSEPKDSDVKQTKNGDITGRGNLTEKLSSLLSQNIKLETIKASSVLNDIFENLALTSISADSTLTYQAGERANFRLTECQDLIATIAIGQEQKELKLASISTNNSELLAENELLKVSLSEIDSANKKLATLTEQTESRLTLLATEQQEKLDTAYAHAKELEDEYTKRISTLESRLAELTSENELAILQMKQLQEELEATYLDSEQRIGEFAKQTAVLETRLSENIAEKELASLQINQLQEELEAAYLHSEERNREFAKQTAALETRLSENTAEKERASLQINQLQEDLEAAYLHSEERKGEIAKQTAALETHLSENTAENELALLQINQLQEELEYYYTQIQKMTYAPHKIISYSTNLSKVKNSLVLMSMN